MTPTKQTVCIATEETKKNGYNVPEGFIGKYGYFFTPEQLNQYTRNVIKQSLETAAEKADSFIDAAAAYIEGNVWSEVDKESITNTFEQTYKKFEV